MHILRLIVFVCQISFSILCADQVPLNRMPIDFDLEQKNDLIQEYIKDGRPIMIVTDTWHWQKNGVVTFLDAFEKEFAKLTDNKVSLYLVMPIMFPHIELKFQNTILGYMTPSKFKEMVERINPQAVHLIEFSLGVQAKRVLQQMGIAFTTSYNTDVPRYVAEWVKGISHHSQKPVFRFMHYLYKWFHKGSKGILVPSESMAQYLIKQGYDSKQIRYWCYGVDTELFSPIKKNENLYENFARPISLFVGRITEEKNIEDFLKLDIPGTKVVIGGGPKLEIYKSRYTNAQFLGEKNIEELPEYYASADLFVFPSLTDSFGLVQLEALACGIPVVAYRVKGPIDAITSDKVGILADYDKSDSAGNLDRLRDAWAQAIKLKSEDCREYAEQRTWERSALEFLYFQHRLPKKAPINSK